MPVSSRAGKKSLVIVESPTKARTIGRFLGSEFIVKASMGHVRDLPADKMGVDVRNGFEPTYVVVKGKEKIIAEIKRAARSASAIFLATDQDREGEAISWHLIEAAGLEKNHAVKRVVFHEITSKAIKESFDHPGEIDAQMVEAQQARRILDRLVGFELSKFVRRKVTGSAGAGRVQSVALRLIVDREREIEAFKPDEFWVITVDLNSNASGGSQKFKASLHQLKGEKGRPEIGDGKRAATIVADLDASSYRVSKVSRREVKQKPRPPFTTSTLQQQAGRSLRYSAKRTMQLAQQLYQGVQIGNGDLTGLITYMRTDSQNVSEDALSEANKFIKSTYGPKFADKPRVFKTKSQNAQEAHEAIRPTSISNTPERMAAYLDRDQIRLYELIWKRMVASQMTDAIVDRTMVEIEAVHPSGRNHTVRSVGSVIRFAGFRTLYIEEKDEDDDSEDSRELPDLHEGDTPVKVKVNSDQKFTQPPPRFTEANLIRSLEELGVGRPSTYSTIIGTLEKYVERVARRFKPTKAGLDVSDLLVEYFPAIMDTGFTSEMESKLDAVAEGDAKLIPTLTEFYTPFSALMKTAIEKSPGPAPTPVVEMPDEICVGGGVMVMKTGKYGPFVSCPDFPRCRVSYPIHPAENASAFALDTWNAKRTKAMKMCKKKPAQKSKTARQPR